MVTLREAKLLTLEQRKEWAEEQLVSLDSSETERGLVMTLGDVLFAGGSANPDTRSQSYRAEAGAIPATESAPGDSRRGLQRQQRRGSG